MHGLAMGIAIKRRRLASTLDLVIDDSPDEMLPKALDLAPADRFP
jgi:hypothetical protein